MSVVALFPGVGEGPDDRHVDFEEYLTSVGLHYKTRYIYRRVVERLEAAAAEAGFDLARATASQVAALMASKSTGHYGQLGQWRSAMKHYWYWKDRREPPLRAIRVPSAPRMVNKALEPEDARKLAVAARGWWPQGAAVLLGLFLALRREEIAMAQWQRFDPAMEWYTVLGKGDKTATLPVHPVLKAELEPYRMVSGWLFPGVRTAPNDRPIAYYMEEVSRFLEAVDDDWRLRKDILAGVVNNRRTKDAIDQLVVDGHVRSHSLGSATLYRSVRPYRHGLPEFDLIPPGSSHINPATIKNWIAEVYRAAGLEPRSPHILRHTSLTEALDGTGNLRNVMEFARHAKPETTAGYTRTTKEQLRSVVDALDFF